MSIQESMNKLFGMKNWTPPGIFADPISGAGADKLDALAFAEKHLHHIPAAGHPQQPQPGKRAPLSIEVKVTEMEQFQETLKVLKFCFAHMRADHREMAETMLERIYEQ